MANRASLDELKTFANAVRAAGGGNPLDALMPAVPEDPSQCLIARNLNFNCAVDGEEGHWYMHLEDEALAKKIGTALDLEVSCKEYEDHKSGKYFSWEILLPDEIGQIAADFDLLFNEAKYGDNFDRDNELIPYIEESIREVYDIGQINEKGELIL